MDILAFTLICHNFQETEIDGPLPEFQEMVIVLTRSSPRRI
jgi:hypothetical protein